MNKFDLHAFGLPSFGGDGDGGRKAANVKFKGYYTTELTLKAAHPSPTVGDTAWVGETYPGVVYRCDVAGTWLATTDVPPSNTVNLSEYAPKDAVSKEFASVRSDLNEKIEKNAIKQTTGNDPEQVMSQKAVTQLLNNNSNLFTLKGCSIRQNGSLNDTQPNFAATPFIPLPTIARDIKISGYDGVSLSNYTICAFYDVNKVFISRYEVTGSYKFMTVNILASEIPINARYIRSTTTLSNIDDSNISIGIGSVLEELNNVNVPSVFNMGFMTNLFTLNGYINSDQGGLTASSSFVATDFIPLIDDEFLLRATFYPNSTNYSTCTFYDVDKTKISEYPKDDLNTVLKTVLIKKEDIPEGTKYIRSCTTLKNIKDSGIYFPYAKNIMDIFETSKSLESIGDNLSETIDVSYLREEEGYYRYWRTGSELPRFMRLDGYRASILIPIFFNDTVKTTSSILNGDPIGNILFDKEQKGITNIVFKPDGTLYISQDLIDLGAAFIGISFKATDEKKIEIVRPFSATNNTTQFNKLTSDITILANDISSLHNNNKNAFKGLAPNPFKDKLLSADKDVTILLLGDSVTAFTHVGEEFENAPNLPYGCQHNGLTFQLWDSLCKNKPQFDRFDSQINTFIENGTFDISNISKFALPNSYGEFSPANMVYRETQTIGDYYSFNWNLEEFEKLNLIGRMGLDGTKNAVISCPEGKILIKHNERANPKNDGILYPDNAWVEANGYSFNQFLPELVNHTNWLRNFPIKFKRVSSIDEDITITVTNNGEGTLYYWGTERWNFNTLHLVNLARGGRHTVMIENNMPEDISYRDVDLVIWQIPLWNDMKNGTSALTLQNRHTRLINSLSTLSNNFEKFQVIVTLGHSQLASWEGNNSIPFQANGISTAEKSEYPDWIMCSKFAKNIMSHTDYGENKLMFANIYNEIFNFAIENNMTMEELLGTTNPTDIGDGTSVSGIDTTGFTTDGTHLSSRGFAFYTSLIAPMMYD